MHGGLGKGRFNCIENGSGVFSISILVSGVSKLSKSIALALHLRTLQRMPTDVNRLRLLKTVLPSRT